MKRILSALSVCFLTTCAHAPHARPISMASAGIICADTLQVVCLIDDDLSVDQCKAVVVPAVRAINAAVGRELLRFAGTAPGNPALALSLVRQGTAVVFGDDLTRHSTENARVLGLTRPFVQDEAGAINCITGSLVGLERALIATRPALALSVATHELCHALGFTHADENIASIEAPNVNQPSARPTLTAADRASLVAVYGS